MPQNVLVAMGANTLYPMTESYKKGSKWSKFWWQKPESVPASPNTGCSRGSKRERLRRALSQKLKNSQFSVKHRKVDFLKWPKRSHFSPTPAAVTASPEFTLNDLQPTGAIEPVGVFKEKRGHQNEARETEGLRGEAEGLRGEAEGLRGEAEGLRGEAEGLRGETATEGVFSGGKSIANEKSVSGQSLKQVSMVDHTLLSKIRSKWLKPDTGPTVMGASNRKSIAFLHEMRPGLTTTEVSYTNA